MSCSHCKRPIVDLRFYALSFGALLRESETCSRMADQAELPAKIFLGISVHDHGALDSEGDSSLEFSDDMKVVANQAEIHFCSKSCMKAWFSERVDRLKNISIATMNYPAIDNLPPVHPGEILRDELGVLSMSAGKFAEHIRVPLNAVTGLLNGESGVSAQMALRLGQAFGSGPGFWMRLQATYEEKCARADLTGVLEQISQLHRGE